MMANIFIVLGLFPDEVISILTIKIQQKIEKNSSWYVVQGFPFVTMTSIIMFKDSHIA